MMKLEANIDAVILRQLLGRRRGGGRELVSTKRAFCGSVLFIFIFILRGEFFNRNLLGAVADERIHEVFALGYLKGRMLVSLRCLRPVTQGRGSLRTNSSWTVPQ